MIRLFSILILVMGFCLSFSERSWAPIELRALSNDVPTESQCALELEQLKQEPKLHLAKAKECLAKNEFLNEAIVGEALALQVKALVGERTA